MKNSDLLFFIFIFILSNTSSAQTAISLYKKIPNSKPVSNYKKKADTGSNSLTTVSDPASKVYKSGIEYLTMAQRKILQERPRKNPEQPFNFDNSIGPEFTEVQKRAQLEAGKLIVSMVVKSFENGDHSVRIPPGDYRFGQDSQGPSGYTYPLEFRDLKRDADHTFTIDARGVTFWFDLTNDQADASHSCIGFINCSNIVFRGGTIDRDTRGNIEGCITQIDFTNNRIEIELSRGFTVPKKFNGSYQQRILPFKANGDFCSPLYALQKGGLHLQYKDITPSRLSGRFWVEMKDRALLNTIHDPNWINAYGSKGIIDVGDGLFCLYTTTIALTIKECKNVTMQGVNIYVPRGWGRETGGYGAHLWKDCYLGPRPGTNQWNGGENFMFDATRHGTTIDNVTVLHTTDDPANFHGYWGNIVSVKGTRITFGVYDGWRLFLDVTLPDVAKGDRILFYSRATGKLLGNAIVENVNIEANAINIDRSAADFANALAEFPEHACGGWTIQNSNWHDNYQRILVASGPGTIRNCNFVRNGSSVQLNSNLNYVEGGTPQNITIEDNVFTDVNPQPGGVVIDVSMIIAGKPVNPNLISNIKIIGNTFNNPGKSAISLNGATNCSILNNHIDNPIRYTALATSGPPNKKQAIILANCSRINVEGNRVSDPGNYTDPNSLTGSNVLGIDDKCKQIMLNGKIITFQSDGKR